MERTTSPSLAARGLSPQAVERSRQKHGSNALTKQGRSGFGKQLLSNFGDPIIKILLAALLLNLLFVFKEQNWFESVGIAIAIFLATFVSTLSEYGSESAFLRLQQEAQALRCRVMREGKIALIPLEEVVVGDLVLLESGERVPADGLLVEGKLAVDQSSLNGESREAQKTPGGAQEGWDLSRENQLFRGTVVCAGNGLMQVQRVGDSTFYGGMARQMQQDTRQSPLKLRLEQLADTLSRLGFAAAILVALADLLGEVWQLTGFQPPALLSLFSQPPQFLGLLLESLTLAVTVLVVAVPEGLPMMITVVLSSNMRRMLRDHVLVRKLVGIETSGSLNILFTDKTGTLTRGKLQVRELVTGEGGHFASPQSLREHSLPLYRLCFLCGAYNNESSLSGQGQPVGGNATDRALLGFFLTQARQYTAPSPSWRSPFDSRRKFSAVTLRDSGQTLTLVKGAPEQILPGCTQYLSSDGSALPFSQEKVRRAWKELTKKAYRVLALAYAPGETGGSTLSGLTFLGLIAIGDTLRPQVKKAVEQVKRAGVQVVMITGDNKDTALAMGEKAGLCRENDRLALTHDELAALSDEEVKALLPRLRVVARAMPQDKSRLVTLAQEMGLVAGMTGDGINDAPALKLSDVGFAMGSGTEVAKEAGDIVILDDNFQSIGKAILYGRTIFKSIRKFIVFQLTMNLCAVGVSVLGPFLGVENPITVVQMLWVNIIMDTLAALAYAGEAPLEEYMEEPPKKRDEPIFTSAMLHQVLCMGLYTILLCLAFLKLPLLTQVLSPQQASFYLLTGFFALFIFCGVFNSFNARTERLNLLAHLGKNPRFLLVMIMVGLVQCLLIYRGGSLFRTSPLSLPAFQLVLLLAFSVIPVDFVRKLILRRGPGGRLRRSRSPF